MPTLPDSATDAEFTAFLAEFGFDAIAAANQSPLLNLSYLVLCALPFCDDAEIDAAKFQQAQGLIARAINNGQLDPAGSVDVGRFQSERSIGRSAIVRRWQVDANAVANASEPLERLKSIPLAYALLKPYMCPVDADTNNNCNSREPAVFCV